MLLLQADLLDLKANPDKPARGAIVEAKLDRGRGPVATVLVQEGTLKPGDPFVCGPFAGRVRAMIDDRGHKVMIAYPSTPVEILGLPSVPEAGSSFVVVADEATARQVAEHRAAKHREASLLKTSKVSLEDLYRQVQAATPRSCASSSRPTCRARPKRCRTRCRASPPTRFGSTFSIRRSAASPRATVMLASAFRTPSSSASTSVRRRRRTPLPNARGVDVRLYEIIYDAINDVRDAMEGLLEPTYKEKVLGRAEVRNTFSIPSVGLIAGCLVTDGEDHPATPRPRLVRDQHRPSTTARSAA
jgi:translation initiation factor IF-2